MSLPPIFGLVVAVLLLALVVVASAAAVYVLARSIRATNRRVWSNQALNISVSAGDRIEITFTTPAWPTNPAGCRFWGHVTVRR